MIKELWTKIKLRFATLETFNSFNLTLVGLGIIVAHFFQVPAYVGVFLQEIIIYVGIAFIVFGLYGTLRERL